jgi:ubiquinone biosynthesis protein COQ9
MTEETDDRKTLLLDAALMHVPFDGWSPQTFRAAVADTGIDAGLALAICPRGALDLAVAFHKRGDAQMVARYRAEDLATLRYSERIARLVRFRLEVIEDKEAVRRGATLFALPQHAAEGAQLIWGTCDLIWRTLGDTSDDINWYTKRATLSGVYSSTLLYWLGDDSPGQQATWDFLDRRIANVMQIEKIKAQARANPVLGRVLAGPDWLMRRVKAPARPADPDLPGSWVSPRR